MTTKQKLESLVTQWDKMQSTKKGYNSNALALYLFAVDSTIESMGKGKTLDQALEDNFNDRLFAFLLKGAHK